MILTEGDALTSRLFFKNITVIQNPVTLPQYQKTPELTNKKAIAVGRFEHEKGFDYLIEVWKKVYEKHPEWTLDIFGEGSLKLKLENQISENELTATIFLRSPNSNIAEKYLESSVFILSSRHEGFVLVLLEAMSLGIPSVSFNCKFGPVELINDGENGFLADVGNTEMLASKINILIENKLLRQNFSKQSITSTQKYKLPQIMEQWSDLFKSVLN